MKKNRILSILLGLAMIVSLAGCGNSNAPSEGQTSSAAGQSSAAANSETSAPAEKEQITLWHYYTTVNGENFEKLVGEYNEVPEGKVQVKLELIPRNELLKKYTLGIASGDLPEIALVDNPDAPSFAAAGMFVDVTDKLASSDIPFVDGPLLSGQYDGKQYTVPFRSNCLGMFVNDEHLKAAGVDKIPETWDELLSACEKLKGANGSAYAFGMSAVKSAEGVFHFMPFFGSTGATVETINSEAGVKAFQLYETLSTNGYISAECINWTQNDVEKQFAAGNVSMMINGSWQISNLTADAPDLEYTIAYIPKDAKSVSSLGGENMGITTSAKDVDACWDFVTWMLSKDHNVPFNVAGATFSPRADVTPEEQYPDDEKMQMFVKLFQVAEPRGPHPKWTEISGAFEEGIQSVLTKSQTPAEAAETVAGKVDTIAASVK